MPYVGIHLGGVATELLPERQRGRILRVRATDLDDALPFLRLGRERLVQQTEPRQENALRLRNPARPSSVNMIIHHPSLQQ